MKPSAAPTQHHASLDFAGFAQEFLRRNRDYRDQYAALRHVATPAGQEGWARHWGLVFRNRP